MTYGDKSVLDLSVKEFLARAHFTEEVWEKSGCDWTQLLEIAVDFERSRGALTDTAEFFAKTIQRFGSVHSVRWRVKDTEHLLSKIVRKRLEDNKKYASIDVSNYFDLVTDLVGVRALHLFKDDFFATDEHLRERWVPIEDPIAYTRKGDDSAFEERLAEQGFAVKVHPAGYRSLHYVFESKPMQRVIKVEMQVRTLFEEGWSEIDHKVRYPNFTDNELVVNILKILNRMAGSADEMGGFVQGLVSALDEHDDALATAIRDRESAAAKADEASVKLEATLGEIDALRTDGRELTELKELTARLKKELSEYKNATYLPSTIDKDFRDQVEKMSRLANSINVSSGPGLSDVIAAQHILPDSVRLLNARLKAYAPDKIALSKNTKNRAREQGGKD